MLLLIRKLVRVPLRLLWFGTSTTNIHEIVKSGNENLTQDKHHKCNLLRRHAIYWELFRRDTYEPRHIEIVKKNKDSVTDVTFVSKKSELTHIVSNHDR